MIVTFCPHYEFEYVISIFEVIHIDKLNERLEQLGYKTHFEMKVAQDADERLDFVKDFIEKDIRPASGGQYLFDVKA